MEQGYPSREVTGTWIEKLEAETDEGLKSGFGYAYRCMMAMHDELDARQAEISKRDDSIGQLMRQIDGVCIELADKITENTELNERIDAYIDLVRRMADELKGWSTGSVHYPTINLLDEAEAMTGGNYDV